MTWRQRLKDIFKRPSVYAKTVVAVAGVVVLVATSAASAVELGYGDGTWDAQDTISVLVAIAVALGVYGKRNAPE
jgi:NhaP-type Na+/H+ or K+/H+ antiporter